MAAKIVDSTGKTVGKFIQLLDTETALVEMTFGGTKYMQYVFPDRIGDEGTFPIYYTEEECAGQIYVPYEETVNAGYFEIYTLTALGWLSRHPLGVTPQTLEVISESDTNSSFCNPIERTIDVTTLAQASAPDFRAGFTPPFSFVA